MRAIGPMTPGDILVTETDRAGALADDPHHRFQCGGLAGAVAPEQGDHLAGVHLKSMP